jgi:hypothetical protein
MDHYNNIDPELDMWNNLRKKWLKIRKEMEKRQEVGAQS